jgi:pimeloyl-ACP methyl ester carboxylesterase
MFSARLLLLPLALLSVAAAQPKPVAADLGANLERFDYPYPVKRFRVTSQGQPVDVAYMDLAPRRPNGRTVVMLHGKNFCGATWGETAHALAVGGYRVIVIDQVGFCKSSKPTGFQYSFHALAEIDAKLIDSLGIDRFILVGHSMGGMLATRFALLHPLRLEWLVLVNPLGLANRLAQGVPYADVDTLVAEESATTAASIKAYQLRTYYHGRWNPDYDRWVEMLAGMYRGPGKPIVVAAQARASEMIQTQPVAYEFGRLRVPTTLMVGMLDTTAFGRQRAPLEIRNSIPAIPELARRVVGQIPEANLIPFDDLGHAPHVEAPARFQTALLKLLAVPRQAPTQRR